MRRAFVAVTAGVGTAIGWSISIAVGAVVGQPAAHLLGTLVGCLFVGSVFGGGLAR